MPDVEPSEPGAPLHCPFCMQMARDCKPVFYSDLGRVVRMYEYLCAACGHRFLVYME